MSGGPRDEDGNPLKAEGSSPSHGSGSGSGSGRESGDPAPSLQCPAGSPRSATQEIRILCCLDGHDRTRHGSGDFLQWMLVNHPEVAKRCSIKLFGHVHNDTSIPLVRSIGKVLGTVVGRTERARLLRDRMESLQSVVVAECAGVNIHSDLEDSERSMMAVYPSTVRTFAPHYVLLNERTDADDVFSPFGTEAHKLHHTLRSNHTTLVIAKTRFTSRHLDTDGPVPLTMHYILLVDAELTASSRRAIECVRDLLGPVGRGGEEQALNPPFVSVLCCWSMPDVATAMYSSDARWHQEKKKCQYVAKKAATLAMDSLRALHPHVSGTTHTSCDGPAQAASKVIKLVEKSHVPCYHNVVVGGGRVIVKDEDTDKAGKPRRSRSFSNVVGLAKRRVFGSTADAIVGNVEQCGAVCIAY